jgi:hypothetical protein
MNARPEQVIELVIDIDYGQVYIYGRAPWERPGAGQKEADAVLRALDDARASGLMVGSDSGLIDLLSPVQYHYHAPLELELWAEQPVEDDGWDHVVDVDLDAPTGEIQFQQSGDTEVNACAEVPPGSYRARIAGRGYDLATANGAVEGGADSYRIQLWPRTGDSAPALVKRWTGWPE